MNTATLVIVILHFLWSWIQKKFQGVALMKVVQKALADHRKILGLAEKGAQEAEKYFTERSLNLAQPSASASSGLAQQTFNVAPGVEPLHGRNPS